jgi:hypothetical protein
MLKSLKMNAEKRGQHGRERWFVWWKDEEPDAAQEAMTWEEGYELAMRRRHGVDRPAE